LFCQRTTKIELEKLLFKPVFHLLVTSMSLKFPQYISLWCKLKADILKSVFMTAIEGYEKRHHYFTSIVVAVSKFDSGVISSRRSNSPNIVRITLSHPVMTLINDTSHHVDSTLLHHERSIRLQRLK
jgi:hypothetical protein